MRTKSCIFSILIVSAVTLWGQEFRATISGHVYDASSAAVPGAKVEATNTATNETTKATTEASGAYTLPFLRPGNYRLTVTASGFKQFIRDGMTLEVGKVAGVDVSLEVGQVSESVQVTAEAAILETQTASRSGVVNSLQVSEIPLNSRNPFMLGAIMPGVTFNGAAIWQRPFDNGAIAEWSINGSRNSSNEFLMDGASNNGQMGGNNIAYVPIVDAVQEFNVQMNSYNAEYGHTGGGIFNVVLKSGTNSFHAIGWEYLRRTPLDANTFQNNSIGAKRTQHSLDQYGFQLEGPVYIPKLLKKDGPVRLFYMGSFENYRESTPNPLNLSYPEAEMRQGDFSKLVNSSGQPVVIYNPFAVTFEANGDPIRQPFPGNKIPGSLLNPIAQAVTKYMPLPNRPAPKGFAYSRGNLAFPDYFAVDKFYNLILKFDWNFGDKHRAFVRHASNDRTEDRNGNGIFEGAGQDGQQPFQRINDAYVVDWVSTLTPTFIVNVRGSYNRFIEKGFGRGNVGFDLKSLGLPGALVDSLPGPRYFGRWDTGYTSLGRYQGINISNTFGLMANATKILGNHTIKAGIDIRQINFIQQDSGNILQFGGAGNFTQKVWNQGDNTSGDGYASFLLGLVNGSSNYPLYPFWKQWYVAPFVQDDWKISRRLTLNLGLRWDANDPPHEKHNRLNGPFDPSIPNPVAKQLPASALADNPNLANLKGGLTFAGINGVPSRPAHLNLGNWQPRFGFAYQLSEKLVMRGGIGEYFINPSNDFLKTAGFSTNTGIINSNDGGRTPVPGVLSNPYPTGINVPSGAALGAQTFLGRDFAWFDPNFKSPYVWQFSYGFQYQVSKASTIDFSYVGSRSYNINMQKAYNIPSLDFRKKCNPLEGGSVSYCDEQLTNPFKGVEAFRGTGFFTNNTLPRYQLARPYPQFSGDLTQQGRNDSRIWYNSFQTVYNLRLRGGLNILGNYTFSKQIERWGFNDPFADVQQQGPYFLDRPHSFKLTTIYELPFGKGKHFASGAGALVDKFIGGWELTNLFIDQSGTPTDLPGNVRILKDPKVKPNWKDYQVRGLSPCVAREFNDGHIEPMQYALGNNCGTDTSKYSWLILPNYAPRETPYRSGNIRKHHAFTMDASLNKTTNITERLKLQIGIEAFNVLNHNYYGRDSFNTNPFDPNFGTIFPAFVWTGNGFPRQGQIRMKVMW